MHHKPSASSCADLKPTRTPPPSRRCSHASAKGNRHRSSSDDDGGEAASSSTQDVSRELREAIVSLKLAPGAEVSESHVMRWFGGSRTPVRLALERLEREGLLVALPSRPKRRLVVAPLTQSDMRELFHIAGSLNGLAARLAAQLPDEPRRQLVGALQRINRDLERLVDVDHVDVIAADALDSVFHGTYERATNSPRLVHELELVRAPCTRYVRLFADQLDQSAFRGSLAQHAALIEALAEGDPERAEYSAALNHRTALQRFCRGIRTTVLTA